jgi:hypothetical membrane protein
MVVSPTASRHYAGALLASAGAVILMGIITAEALYPGDYTTFDNEISDLGATRPPGSIILQPSATIFDVTMVVTGLFIVVAAVLLGRAQQRRFLTSSVALTGVGVFGVGVFPGNVGAIHPWFALLAFLAGGLCGIAGWAASTGVLRWISAVLGATALVTLLYAMFAGLDAPLVSSLGDGGTERWVAYPVVLWLVMFGGALMGPASQPGQEQVQEQEQEQEQESLTEPARTPVSRASSPAG